MFEEIRLGLLCPFLSILHECLKENSSSFEMQQNRMQTNAIQAILKKNPLLTKKIENGILLAVRE